MKLREATPSHYEHGPAFVTRARGCGLEDIRVPVYCVSPQAKELRTLRRMANLKVGDVAGKLGIHVLELLGMERGRFVPENPNDWEIVMKALNK